MPPKKDEKKENPEPDSFESAIEAGWNFIEEGAVSVASMFESGIDNMISFIRNECILMERAKQIVEEIGALGSDIGNFIYEEPNLNGLITLLLWVVFCYVFEVWMLPLLIPFIFLRQYLRITLRKIKFDDEEQYPEKKVEGKSITEMLKELCDLSDDIDRGIMIVSSFIRITKRTFQFKEPEILYVVLLISMLVAVILYYINLRYFIIIGSVYLFAHNYLKVHGYLKSRVELLAERMANDLKNQQKSD